MLEYWFLERVFLREAYVFIKFPHFPDQCATVRKRTARYSFVHYSALSCELFRNLLWQFIFFMLHFFHVALFPCLSYFTVSTLHFFVKQCFYFAFRVVLFLCIALFQVAVVHIAIFSFCILLLLYSLHVAIFSCCTLFTLHYFQRWSLDDLRWTFKMQSFATIIDQAVKYCCKDLHLRCSPGSSLRLCYFHVALFYNQKHNQKTTLHSKHWTCFTFVLISITSFCHYLLLNGW